MRVASSSLCLLMAAGWLAAPLAAYSAGHRLTFRQTYLGAVNNSNYTYVTAVADFDGDGNADVAVPLSGSNQLLVYHGDGHGRFGPPATYASGIFPTAIVTGDFNGDGKPDIVLGDVGIPDIGVEILLNDGKGGFNAPVFIPVDGYIQEMVVGDFSRDGNLDIALSLPLIPGGAYNLYGTAVLLGDGHGGFGAPVIVSTGGGGVMAVGDFNGDGIPDLAVTGSGYLQILLGNGVGGFTLVNTYYFGGGIEGVATADFNHDGHVDIALAEGSGFTNEVDIFLGDGFGGFTVSTIVPINDVADGLVAVDLDGDGNADLATADYFSNAISVVKGDGRGGFGAAKDFPLTVPMAPSPVNITAGDFNGDGLPDFVTSDSQTGGATVLVTRYR
ncbi:MAG: FG-GAP repeat domain-containing protein [Chthoniobacterales bacterium]